jgi:hypothetical protein
MKPRLAQTRALWGAVLMLALELASCQLPAGAEPPPLVVRGGQIFDSAAAEMRPAAAVVIDRGRIQQVIRPGEKFTSPAGARVIDATGKYLIPGLIDGHTHVTHVLRDAGVTATEILPLYLANGITTLRSTGDTLEGQQHVAQFVHAHPEKTPRLFLGSPLFDKSPPYHAHVSLPITSAEQVSPFVDHLARAGVQTFKIYVGMDRTIGSAIIREAHRHGRWAAAHLRRYRPLDAIADGIDGIEHIESIFDFVTPPEVPVWPLRDERTHLTALAVASLRKKILEEQIKTDFSHPRATGLIEALVKHRVAVNPTLVVYRNWMLLSDAPEVRQHPDLQRIPTRLLNYWLSTAQGAGALPETADLRRKQFAKLQELTGVLYRAGVELMAGTDAPVHFCPPGFALHQELELLVASGLPPAAALIAATRHNARSLNQSTQLGSIEPGKLADLVLLQANPLVDIRNTRAIALVIRGGIVCEPSALFKLAPAQ